MSSGEKVLQQPAHLIRLLAGGAIRSSPEGQFALRMVIFYIASARPAAAGELFGLRLNVFYCGYPTCKIGNCRYYSIFKMTVPQKITLP